MKRLYKSVSIDGGAILLDRRPARTPARWELVLPGATLARAVAAEWESQGETLDPRTMPLTGLANAALDRIAPDPAAFARGLAAYAESDLLCYRAEGPDSLVERQAELWDPPLRWARARYGVELVVTTGIVPVAQPEAALHRFAEEVAVRSVFALAGLSPLVTASGSLVLALGVAEGATSEAAAWQAASCDETWQAEFWGDDPLAAAARDERRRDFAAGARFLALLG